MDDNPILKMAYGTSSSSSVASGNTYRVERGRPYLRGGKLVYAAPQFKALTIYSPVNNNSQFPASTVTPNAIVYPSKL